MKELCHWRREQQKERGGERERGRQTETERAKKETDKEAVEAKGKVEVKECEI